MADYQLLTCNMAGVPYAEIANAAISAITWELNGWGEMEFSLPATDAQAFDELREDYQTKREVQVWRNGRLIWWGVYVAGTSDDKTITFTCYGLLWYFSRRFFGPVHSNAMPAVLANGNMESTPVTAGWNLAAGVTATAASIPVYQGNQSMKIVTSSVAGTDNFVFAQFDLPSPFRIKPLRVTLRGRLYQETVNIAHPVNVALGLGVGGSVAIDRPIIPDRAPMREWMYFEIDYIAPAGTGTGLVAVLYAPASGTVYWDDVALNWQERTGAIVGEDWSDDYLRRIFNYGAGNTGGGSEGPGGSVGDQKSWWGARRNKSSLNMTWAGTGGASAGSIPSDIWWDHLDEAVIFSAMAELAQRDVLDFEVTWPANGRGERTFTTYAPSKGATKVGMAVEAGKNLVSYRYDADGRGRANDVRVSGRGPGNYRETAQFGGPTVADPPQLEAIAQPPFELRGKGLLARASAEHNRRKDSVKTPTLTVAASEFFDTAAGGPLTTGDTVPVRLENRWAPDANRRVVKMTLRPETETLDLVVNK